MSIEPYYERLMFRVSAIGARSELRFRELLAPLGLVPQAYAVLSRVHAAEGITQQAVADLTGMRRNVMVGIIDGLEKRDLVERRQHPSDRRANALHLTAGGRAILRQAETAADQLNDEILTALPANRRQAFIAAVGQVDDGFGSRGGMHPDTTLLREPEAASTGRRR